ncbi:MAG: ribonuclease HII [Actinomycetes bacterium]
MPSGSSAPTLRYERQLLGSGARLLCSVDEVGRGALSGPVTVGMVLIDATVRSAPAGVRDSKLLTPERRQVLAPRIRRWALGYAVGHASASEIDAVGIIAALRLAGHRALAALGEEPDVILLDGSHDWLTPPAQESMFDEPGPVTSVAPVVTRVKADMTCSSVAAASVLAKTERDDLMMTLSHVHPDYRWDENKGYATPEHLEAIRLRGTCDQHRRSWRLPDREEADPNGRT